MFPGNGILARCFSDALPQRYLGRLSIMAEGRNFVLTGATALIIIDVFRGVAKFGIALGSGPRGRGFESRHSDHIECS